MAKMYRVAIVLQVVLAIGLCAASPARSAVDVITRASGTIGVHTVQPGSNGLAAGDGGLAINATHYWPLGITFHNGRMYIADYSNDAVRVVDLSTGIITTAAGQVGVKAPNPDSTVGAGDGLLATAATLNGPSSIAFDSANNMYIMDRKDRAIRKVDASTGVISTIVGGADPTTYPGGFTPVPGNAADSPLCYVWLIDIDSNDNLYIAESCSNAVLKVTLWEATPQLSVVAGVLGGYNPALPVADGIDAVGSGINVADGVAVDVNGDFYYTDRDHHVIRKVTVADGKVNTVIGTMGTAGHSPDGTLATAALITKPSGIDVDAAGNIYFTEQEGAGVVRKMDAVSHRLYTVAGTFGVFGNPIEGLRAVTQSIDEWNYGVREYDGAVYFGGGNHAVLEVSSFVNLGGVPVFSSWWMPLLFIGMLLLVGRWGLGRSRRLSAGNA